MALNSRFRKFGVIASFLLATTFTTLAANAASLRIYHSPYSGVDWETTARIKAMHHDHPAAKLPSIRAYDDAGYQAMSLMDYSGAPALTYALKRRLWPPESAGIDADFRAKLKNLKIFIPNAEEVGIGNFHMTSPFLTTFISKYNPDSGAPQTSTEYDDPQQLIDVIASNGGVPIIAHPWYETSMYTVLKRFRGMEIYSAFAETKQTQGDPFFTKNDKNAQMVALWDLFLASNQNIIGIAANDHFGPDAVPATTDARSQDSGKIIVFAKNVTLAEYRRAFEAGSLVAVRDIGVKKDQYPSLTSITVDPASVSIETNGVVRWVGNGRTLGTGPTLDYSSIPSGTTYVRAEISNSEGSTLYTQAFSVRPVGDANGDGVVDRRDTDICARVRGGQDTDPDHSAACAG